MKKIIKKVIKETIEDKRLQIAYVYLSNYMNTLEEVFKDNGRIYLCESGDEYANVCVVKKDSICCVEYDFWKEFSKLFSLKYLEVQSIITRWAEDTYQLKGINTVLSMVSRFYMLKIPTN